MLNLESIPILLAASFIFWMLIKNVKEIRVHSEKKWISVTFVLFFISFITALPFMIVIVLLLWVYRNIIDLILKLTLGNSYYHLVKRMDIWFSISKTEFWLNQILVVLECDTSTTGENFYQVLKKFLLQYQEQCEKDVQKLYCSLEEWMGYTYYKKIQVDVDDYVLKLPVNHSVGELDRSNLSKLLSDMYYDVLPLNNTMLWDIHIGTQPLKSEKPGIKQYPILFRFHHTLGDGIALMRLFFAVFGEGNQECFEGHSSFTKYLVKKRSWYKTVLVTFDMFTMMPNLTFKSWFLNKQSNNDMFYKSIKKEILSYGSDENGKYLRKVKAIKKRCSLTSFSAIIVTVLSAAIQECFQKYKTTSPTQIICLFPYITNYQHFLDCSTEKGEEVPLINKSILLQLAVPLFIDNHKNYVNKYPLTSRLTIIKQTIKGVITPAEYMFKGVLFPYMAEVIPAPILRILLSYFHLSLVFTILPGPSKFTINKLNMVISEFTFWAPHANDTGPNFAVLTYNSQLKLGVNCNGSAGLPEEAATGMINSIYRNIDLLEQEIIEQDEEH